MRHRARRQRSRAVGVVATLIATLWLSLLPTTSHAQTHTTPTDTPLVLAGVAGLQWSDIDAMRTPNLWRLVGSASVASSSVRTLTPTCPVDAWLSLSAGSRVVADADEPEPQDEPSETPDEALAAADTCPPVPAPDAGPGLATASVPGWEQLVAPDPLGTHGTSLGAVGGLAEAVGTCTTAAGPGAAVTLADPDGDVDRYTADPRTLTGTDLADCPVTVVDLGALPDSAVERSEAVAAVDTEVGRLAGELPAGGRLVVAGLADTPLGPTDLQVVIDWTAPGSTGTWLTSTSSRWPGVVVTADLSAMLAEAVLLGAARDDDGALDPDVTQIAAAFTGSALERGEERRLSTARTVENRQYLSVLTETLPRMLPVLVAVLALAVVSATVVMIVARRRGRTAPHRTRLALAVVAVAACLPVGATLATLSRWWVWPTPVTVLSVAITVATLGVALAAWWSRRLLPPSRWRLPLTLSAATWLVLTVDGLMGTTLQQGSLLGPAPSLGARFYGFSNSVFAVYAVVGLVLAAALVAVLRERGAGRRAQVAAAAAVGVVTCAVDGLPPFGADLGGILALVPAFAVLVLGVAGIRITWLRAAALAVATVVVVALVAVVDWVRPPTTHLGGFVQSLLDGNVLNVVIDKAAGAWATVANPFGAVGAVLCLVIAWAALDPRRARLRRVTAAYERDPLLRRAVVAVVTVGVLGTVLNDSGIVVAMWVVLVALPVLLAGALDAALEAGEQAAADDGGRGTARSVVGTLTGVAAAFLVALQLGAAALPAGGLAHAGDVTDAGTAVLDGDAPLVIVGTDGLRWEDVTPSATPTLWAMLRDGASAGGVTTSVTGPSADCVAAGWLGMSSGRSAVTGEFVDGTWRCAGWDVTALDGGAVVDGWDELTLLQERSEFRPRLGVLAETFAAGDVCTTAVGPAAALALAGPGGEVARYRGLEAALADPADAFGCPVTFVDAGAAPFHPTGTGSDARPVDQAATAPGTERDEALRAVDDTVRRVLDATGADATVLVLDAGNPAPVRPALGVGVARTHAEAAPSYLTSAATRWLGVVRLLDLPPTLVAAYDLPRPAEFAGAPVTLGYERPSGTGTTVGDLDALTERDHALRVTTGSITGLPTYVAIAAFLLVVLLLPRLRRRGAEAPVRRWSRGLEVTLLVTAAVPAATFLMTTAGWWRMTDPPVGLWASLLGATALVALIGALAPRRPAWAAPVLIATVTFVVLTLDGVLGTPLHRGSPLGAAPTLGGRFYGFGNPTYSVYAVASVICAAGLATMVVRRWNRVAAGLVASAVGLVALVVIIWPTFGVDVGGGLVLLPVYVVVALAAFGARLTWTRFIAAGAAGVLLVAVIGVLDWMRPVAERSHLGAFVQSVVDGTALETVGRKAGFALRSLSGGFDAWLAIAVVVAVVLALWGPVRWRPRWLAEAEAAWPMTRPVLIALFIAGVGGAVANDYGIRIVSIMLFAGVPLLGLLVLRSPRLPEHSELPPQDSDVVPQRDRAAQR